MDKATTWIIHSPLSTILKAGGVWKVSSFQTMETLHDNMIYLYVYLNMYMMYMMCFYMYICYKTPKLSLTYKLHK